MNIFSVESKFKEIEKRESLVRSYFNPFSAQGPKHYCIKDLHHDFEYDTQLYGLGNYYRLQLENQNQNLKVPPVESETQDRKKNKTKTDSINVIIPENPRNAEPMPRLYSEKSQAVKTSGRSQDKDLTLLDKCKPLHKEEYCGNFSRTKIGIKHKICENKLTDISPPEWKASYIGRSVNNKSALERIHITRKSYESEIDLQIKSTRDKTQLDPKDYEKEKFYQEKPRRKFKIDLNSVSKNKLESQKKNPKVKWFDIRYTESLYWKPEVDSLAKIINIENPEESTITITTKIIDTFYLPDIKILKVCRGCTLRIQLTGDKFQEFYLHFDQFSEDIKKAVETKIDIYLSELKAVQQIRSSISPILPLTLKRLSEKSPLRSRSTIKLPLIQEKNSDYDQSKYLNPITQRLIMYKESQTNFKPSSFKANLAIFEMHDIIENKYKKNYQAKKIAKKEEIALEIKGEHFNHNK